MPSVEDWVNKPLEIVQNIITNSPSDCQQKVKEYFTKRISEPNGLSKIPSLNACPSHELPANSLVRFRCMVQDMYDTEFYLGSYEVVHVPSQRRYMRSGMYKDVADCQSSEEVDIDSTKNKTLDRLSYYCISVPGENIWVQKGYSSVAPTPPKATTSAIVARHKRSFGEDSSDDDCNLDNTSEKMDMETSGANENKRSRTGNSSQDIRDDLAQGGMQTAGVSLTDLNFPIPDMKGVACLLKVYNQTGPISNNSSNASSVNDQDLKVNDMVEVIGILSFDPCLAHSGTHVETDSMEATSSTGDFEESSAVHSPPSLVPRLHAVVFRKLDHVNPFLPWDMKMTRHERLRAEILSKAPRLRCELHSFLTQALLGDALAAEYLLCHLISSIYVRKEVVALGKFSLNLLNVPLLENYTIKLYQFLSQLISKSHWLPLSLNNLNTLQLTPKKDYTKNRLVSGLLQLSAHTHLVLDETALTVGRLEASGIRNVTALGNLIHWQRVEYDFSFNRMEFTSDIAVLVLSEGKSLLPSDCRVPLKINSSLGGPENIFTTLLEQKNPKWLEEVRCYLTLLKLVNYTMSEDLQKAVQDDFVKMRKENQSVSADDLHALLVLARFLSLSQGETSLSKESWEKAKTLECERKKRLVENN